MEVTIPHRTLSLGCLLLVKFNTALSHSILETITTKVQTQHNWITVASKLKSLDVNLLLPWVFAVTIIKTVFSQSALWSLLGMHRLQFSGRSPIFKKPDLPILANTDYFLYLTLSGVIRSVWQHTPSMSQTYFIEKHWTIPMKQYKLVLTAHDVVSQPSLRAEKKGQWLIFRPLRR